MCVNSSQHEDDDEDSTEENTVFVPDASRTSPRLGLTPEALVALKPERGVPAMSMAAQRRSSLDAVIAKLSTPPAPAPNDALLTFMMKMEEREQQWRMEQAEIRRQDRDEREREARKREEKHDMLMMAFMSKLMGTSDSK
ncbi:hypothetical protein AC1031_004806 [Aphanomyces cochlioides]|nr:hypothetical protein AC1031_004806 [Aphanomyces cochlioides]